VWVDCSLSPLGRWETRVLLTGIILEAGARSALGGYWAKEVHHGLAGLINWHWHGRPLVVVATVQKHVAVIGTWGCLLLGRALY
jgi:hypothetical protein